MSDDIEDGAPYDPQWDVQVDAKLARLKANQFLLAGGLLVLAVSVTLQARVMSSVLKTLNGIGQLLQIPQQAVDEANRVQATTEVPKSPVAPPDDPGPRESPEWIKDDPITEGLGGAVIREPGME